MSDSVSLFWGIYSFTQVEVKSSGCTCIFFFSEHYVFCSVFRKSFWTFTKIRKIPVHRCSLCWTSESLGPYLNSEATKQTNSYGLVDNERGAPTAAGLVANCLFLSKKSRWCFSFLEASFVDADLIVSTKNASWTKKKRLAFRVLATHIQWHAGRWWCGKHETAITFCRASWFWKI
jgi:hypothetical protein